MSDEKYLDKEVTLVINNSFLEIYTELDLNKNIQCIGIDIYKFENNFFYLLHVALKLQKFKYDDLISCIYSRFFYADVIAYFIDSRNKVTFADTGITSGLLNITNKIYSRLIHTERQFDFYANKQLVEKFLGKKLNTQFALPATYTFKPNKIYTEPLQGKQYIVMVIGATEHIRTWSLDNFINLAELLNKHYGYTIVIVGSKQDESLYKNKLTSSPDHILNLLGQTSFSDLLSLCHASQFIVSNETGVVHLGCMLNKCVFVVSCGNSYGRFSPYPLDMKVNYNIIYPSGFEELNCNENEVEAIDINLVTVAQVYSVISNKLTINTMGQSVSKPLNIRYTQ